jgi:hypothetical protein
MKKIIYFAMAAAVMCGCAKSVEETTGSIVGFVTNDLQHELQRAKITLTDNAGKKETTETGTDGRYEFQNLILGQSYTVVAELSGYHTDTLTTLVDRIGVRGDFVLKEIGLRLNTNSINAGTNEYADFIIYNDSRRDMVWVISTGDDWISVSKTGGTIQAARAEPIHLTFDKNLMSSGIHETKIVVNSSHEYAELAIRVEDNLPTLITHQPTIVSNADRGKVTLTGNIAERGSCPIFEAGFLVGEYPDCTVETTSRYASVTNVPLNTIWTMNVNLTGFWDRYQIYYIRTYAITTYGNTYGNEVVFVFQ